MNCYVKIFPIKDGYKNAEETINKYLRQSNGLIKITSISQLGEHHIIAVFEKIKGGATDICVGGKEKGGVKE